MKTIICDVLSLAVLLSAFCSAEDASFNKVKLADAKGKQIDARLNFHDSIRALEIKVGDRDVVSIPYDSLDKVSYEYTKKHRITQGAVVMVASLGAGAIVMMTKSKSHWLYIDYREQNGAKTAVLRLDKSDYKTILAAVKDHTGKEVTNLGEQDKRKK